MPGNFICILALFTWAAAGSAQSSGAATRSAEPGAGTQITHPRDGAITVDVPSGEFIMGIDEPDADRIARDLGFKQADDLWAWEAYPRRKISVSGFFVDKTELTVERWQKYVKATGAAMKSVETSRRSVIR